MDITPKNPHKARFPVRADELDRLRQARGLSLERLALKADIHVKTLKRILDGQEARLETIQLLANALDLPSCDQLRADMPQKQEPWITVKLELGISKKIFTDYTDTEFVQLLKAVLQSTSQINLVSVVEGSTIITLEMTERDAIRLAHLAATKGDTDLPSEELISDEILITKTLKAFHETLDYVVVDDAKLFRSTTKGGDLRKFRLFTITLILQPDETPAPPTTQINTKRSSHTQ
jgi:transcriptional regulator with XRE-family HTH domain